MSHWVHMHEDGRVEVHPESYLTNNLVFSTRFKFNLYLNYCIKQRYAFYNINKLDVCSQLFDLSNTAKFVFQNELIDQCYCQKIDLDYQLIFTDSAKFENDLYNIMDSQHIKYTANSDYVQLSINSYQTTVANPTEIIGNKESIIWLAWCHAVSLMHGIDLPGVLRQAPDQNAMHQILLPAEALAIDLANQNCFTWKNENTTP